MIWDITISNSTLNKYFRILMNFNKDSKKHLITKLSESIESEGIADTRKAMKLFDLWSDDKNTDEIIKVN